MKCLGVCALGLLLLLLLLTAGEARGGVVVTKDKKISIGPVTQEGKDVSIKIEYGQLKFKADRIKWFTADPKINTCYQAGLLALRQNDEGMALFLFSESMRREPGNKEMAEIKLKQVQDIRRGRKFITDDSQVVETVASTPDPVESKPSVREEKEDLDDNLVYQATKNDLVSLSGKSLRRYDAKNLTGAKYYAVYFSASWCGPCRQFTPTLVTAYNELKKKHKDRFELVFMCFDRTEKDMEKYMEGDKMPWPAVSFDEVRKNDLTKKYGPDGIPHLVILDTRGNVLAKGQHGAIQALRELLED